VRLLIIGVFGLVLLGASTAPARVDPAVRCEAAKLSVLGGYAVAAARCHTPAHGTAPDAACLLAKGARLGAGFVRAAGKGPCPAGGELARVQLEVDGLLDQLAATLQAAGSPCGAGKLRAAGRYLSKLLKARGRNLVRPDPARLAAQSAAARADLVATFTASESEQSCPTTGDGATVASAVETTVAEVVTLVTGDLPLRVVVQPSGRWIGSAVRADALASDPQYGEVLAREFDYLIPESETNWLAVHPAPDVWNWGPVDQIVDFAEAHGMRVKIGALVWWLYFPDYVQSLTPAELRAALEERVRTMVARYRGRVAAYDVVNEAFLGGTSLFPSLFLQKLGPGYVADAFRWAREEDPDALLLLNDLGIEDLGSGSDAFHAFVQGLLADGVPLDGVGLQMHVGITPQPVHLRENIQRFADLGLQVTISELDVQIRNLPGDLATRLAGQGTTYHDVVAACVAVPGCFAVSTWGFTDKYSWIDTFFGADDPLPLDDFYRPKPAYFGLRNALGGS
jgi:endo-1,4-beta-xylanase